jgi:hypothetical protein
VFVNALLLESSMSSQKSMKVMQVGVMIKFVCVAVVCVGMLVLPHDGIAKE